MKIANFRVYAQSMSPTAMGPVGLDTHLKIFYLNAASEGESGIRLVICPEGESRKITGWLTINNTLFLFLFSSMSKRALPQY